MGTCALSEDVASRHHWWGGGGSREDPHEILGFVRLATRRIMWKAIFYVASLALAGAEVSLLCLLW